MIKFDLGDPPTDLDHGQTYKTVYGEVRVYFFMAPLGHIDMEIWTDGPGAGSLINFHIAERDLAPTLEQLTNLLLLDAVPKDWRPEL